MKSKKQDTTASGRSNSPVTARAPNRVGAMLTNLDQPIEITHAGREGIPTAAINALIQNGLTLDEVSCIAGPGSPCLEHKEHGHLDSEQAAAWLRVAKVLALTVEVFGSEKKGLTWLRRPRKLFDGLSAVDLVRTDTGAELVEQTLLQIDSGYFG